jgi:hypothetical protein
MTLVRPSSLPDEIASGYLGRLFRLNGWPADQLGMRELAGLLGKSERTQREVSTAEMLAEVAGMNLHAFVADHTLLPLQRAVTRRAPGDLLGGKNWQSTLCVQAMRSMRPNAYLCPVCVKEDQGFHGFSYWRREHQMPGRFRCSKHGCGLYRVSGNRSFWNSPAESADIAEPVTDRALMCEPMRSAADRFLDVCTALLHKGIPQDESQVSLNVIDRAMQLGLHVRRPEISRELVSDLVKNTFENDWLESVIPGLPHVKKGVLYEVIDRTRSGRVPGFSTFTHALVYAALFSDADEAVNAMLKPREDIKGPAQCTAGPRRIDFNEMMQAYVVSGGGYTAAARHAKVSRNLLAVQLRRHGLPCLSHIDVEKLQRVLSDVLHQNRTLQEACSEHQVRESTVRMTMLSALAPMRTALRFLVNETPHERQS